MKQLLKKVLPVALGLLSVGNIYAQEFKLSGEIRPRTEVRHGFQDPAMSDDYAFFTDQRTSLNFDYTNDFLTFKGVFQDIRTWGSQSQLNYTEGASTGLHEAWALAKLAPKWGLKVGRQEVNLDDQRIFGAVDWTQQARSHDMAKLIFAEDSLKIEFAVAYNQNKPQNNTNKYTIAKNYKALQYLHIHKDFNKNIGASFLFLNNGKQVTEFEGLTNEKNYIRYSQTIGGRVTYKKNKLFLNTSGYYQFGEAGNAIGTTINAYNVALEVGEKLSDKATVILGYERLSGNNQVDGNSENNAFNPFYGTNHKFNGVMDLFYVGRYGGNAGLNDLYLKGKFKLKKHKFGADIHAFASASSILDKDELAESGKVEKADSYLGTEIDLYYATKLKKGVTFKLGYSQMFMSSSMEFVRGGDKDKIQNWAYAMLIFKPTFLVHKTNPAVVK